LRGKYQYSTCARMQRTRATGYSASATELNDAVADYVANYLVPGRALDPADAAMTPLVTTPSS